MKNALNDKEEKSTEDINDSDLHSLVLVVTWDVVTAIKSISIVFLTYIAQYITSKFIAG